MDNENGWGGFLGMLAFGGMYVLGEYMGKKNHQKELEQQAKFDSEQQQINEMNRLRKENEDLKSKMPQVISSKNESHFPLRF